MLKLSAILVLAALVLAGLGVNRICISDAGVSFTGHSAAETGACGGELHGGDNANAITAGGCGDCVDIVADSGQTLPRSEQDFLRVATVPVLVAVLSEVFALPQADTTAEFVPVEQLRAGGFFMPLSTIVLRV